jgi:hypothetical protein
VCGGVPCRAAGEPCSIGAQCCTEVCLDNVCAEDICVPDGLECKSDDECCLGLCNKAAGKCGKDFCSAESKPCVEDLPCCDGLICRGTVCSSTTCYSNGVECSAHGQCCSKRCDPTIFTCLECTAAGAPCNVAGECCSGSCKDGVCFDCLPEGETCVPGGAPGCCFGSCQDVDPSAGGVAMKCAPTCGPLSCGHDECVAGQPLKGDCSPCTEAVCKVDPHCCCEEWDSFCVSEALKLCTNPCG